MARLQAAVYGPLTDEVAPFEGFSERESVITAGSLISIMAYKAIGGYNEALFIDEVDHEYCYRLRREGFQVLLCGFVKMQHRGRRSR